MFAGWSDLEVAGESHKRTEIGRLFRAWGLPQGGVTVRSAALVPEPTNSYDPNAIAVVIDNVHVGYVPANECARMHRELRRAPRGMAAMVRARCWAKYEDGTWWARITLAFSGSTEPERDFAAEAARERENREREAELRRVGAVRGQWWSTHRSAIAELKRQDRLAEAITLIEECAEATYRTAALNDDVPDPWPAVQASIVLRKMKDPGREMKALERYAAFCGDRPVPDQVAERLARARIAGS